MSYFQFKQFRVEQGQASLKVNTDSCLFGAWVATHAEEPAGKVLDIGTGTGLLALMLAQCFSSEIYAVEIDVASARQAAENFAASPWAARLHCQQANILEFSESTCTRFELIICNPPFFSASLQNLDRPDAARHQLGLNFGDLARCVEKLLAPGATAWLLVPLHEYPLLESRLQQAGLQGRQHMLFRDSHRKPYQKVVVQVKKEGLARRQTLHTINIKNETGQAYSDAFAELLAPWYLHL